MGTQARTIQGPKNTGGLVSVVSTPRMTSTSFLAVYASRCASIDIPPAASNRFLEFTADETFSWLGANRVLQASEF